LFVTTSVYTVFAALQWKAMRDTLAEMRLQEASQDHAVLSFDNALVDLDIGSLGARVANQGHKAATIIRYQVAYFAIMVNTVSLIRERVVTPHETVSVGNPYVIGVSVPLTAEVPGQQYIRLEIAMDYNDGLGEIQTVRACFNPTAYNNSHWRATCTWVDPVDLSKGLPNDVTIPPKQKH